MSCPFQESLQDASTDSQQYFSQNSTYGRFKIHCQKKEKCKKTGLFQVSNFASWVQLLITGGGREQNERKSVIISLQRVGSFHLHNQRVAMPIPGLAFESADTQSEVKKCQHLYVSNSPLHPWLGIPSPAPSPQLPDCHRF